MWRTPTKTHDFAVFQFWTLNVKFKTHHVHMYSILFSTCDRSTCLAKRLLRTCIVLMLLAMSLAFPSILTVPLIILCPVKRRSIGCLVWWVHFTTVVKKSDRGVVSPSFFCELAQIVDPSCQIMIVNRCFHSCRHKVVCICPHLRGQLVIVDLWHIWCPKKELVKVPR